MPILVYGLPRYVRAPPHGVAPAAGDRRVRLRDELGRDGAGRAAINDITRPENYWRYFVVTAATVGYGDFFPQSAAGHVAGAHFFVGGIATRTQLADFHASAPSASSRS